MTTHSPVCSPLYPTHLKLVVNHQFQQPYSSVLLPLQLCKPVMEYAYKTCVRRALGVKYIYTTREQSAYKNNKGKNNLDAGTATAQPRV